MAEVVMQRVILYSEYQGPLHGDQTGHHGIAALAKGMFSLSWSVHEKASGFCKKAHGFGVCCVLQHGVDV